MPIAHTNAGDVEGFDQDGVVHFRGVPFAAPPVGDLRFVTPQPVEPWTGIRDATKFGPICPQMTMDLDGPLAAVMERNQVMDEDCLYLNVTTPSLDGSLPVMVWIHGGAFSGGSGSTPIYDGTTFARDGIVYVSMNYRLHALGFLSLDELFEGASGTGNLGILDQVAALQWVRDNIAAFGGDPSNVTIFGESAGGMSVGTLLGTPAAKGLFHRAIPQSGAASHNLSAATARRVTGRALEILGVAPGDWNALRAVPAQRFVEMATQFAYGEGTALLGDEAGMSMPFMPMVDGVTRDRVPIEYVAAGEAADVDLLIGTTAEECRLFIWAMPEAMQALIPIPDPSRWFGKTGRTDDEVRKVYAEAHPNLDDREVGVAIWTDAMFAIPAARLADAQRAHSDNVWSYRLSWRTPILDGKVGSCHALDIPLMFDRIDLTPFLGENPPVQLAHEMHAAWVRFAATGDPNGGALPEWPRHDSNTRPTMNFDVPIAMVNDPDGDVRTTWEGVWAHST